MLKILDHSDEVVAREVLQLQKRSYQVEADLIGCDQIPPLGDTVSDIMDCGETFAGYFENHQLVGLIAYKVDGGILDIHRVVVHPSYFRRGIASQMIRSLEEVPGVEKLIVGTATLNTPAVRLYLNLGFHRESESEVAEGLFITSFVKELT